MKTIIFDIDGTLTDMCLIEKAVLNSMTNYKYSKEIEDLKEEISDTFLVYKKVAKNDLNKKDFAAKYNTVFKKLSKQKLLPKIPQYPMVSWIKKHKTKYNFVYATGGQKYETEYVLQKLDILQYFDLKNSISKTTCRFKKKTGIPFRLIKKAYSNCFLVTDSYFDCLGAKLENMPYKHIGKKDKETLHWGSEKFFG